MANDWDSLLTESNPYQLGDSNLTFYDADTLQDDQGNSFRLAGVDAAETGKVKDPNDVSTWKGPEIGAEKSTEEIARLANELGYTNMKVIQDAGKFGRPIVELYDDQGRAFSQQLLKAGTIDAWSGSGQAIRSSDWGAFLRTDKDYEGSDFDKAREEIAKSALREQDYVNQFKQAQLVSGDSKYSDRYLGSHAVFDYYDRDTASGRSNSPFSTAWYTGWNGVAEAAYGLADMVGETAGVDWLELIGEAGINRARTRQGDVGSFIADYDDIGFGKKGNWSEKLWNTIEYLGTNAAMSAPYMVIGAGASLAAPITGGISLAAPASIYTGQTWNEQDGENKNAAIAIASGVTQAALESLGIDFLFKGVGGKVSKELFEEAAEQLVKRGLAESPEVAAQMITNATRKQIAGYAGDAAKVAAKQIRAGRVLSDLTQRALVAGGGEAITEALQETTGYLGAHWNDAMTGNGKFDVDELLERAQKAAVAGGVLGGMFGAPGAITNAAAWADVAVRQAPADAKLLSDAGKYAEAEVERHGRVQSIAELNEESRQAIANGEVVTPFDARVEAGIAAKKNRSVGQAIQDALTSIPGLYRGSVRALLTPELQARSRQMRILADKLGGNLQQVFSGAGFESEKHHRTTGYKNMVSMPETVWRAFMGNDSANLQRRVEASTKIYDAIRGSLDKDGKFDPNSPAMQALTPEQKAAVTKLHNEMEVLGDKMWADQKKHNPDLGYEKNYLAKFKAFDKGAINKNRDAFALALEKEYNIPREDAVKLTDAILGNSEVDTIDQAFSTAAGDMKPGSHKGRTLKLSENPAFDQFMEKDIFANMAIAAKNAARFTTNMDFVGSRGEVLAYHLDKAVQDGEITDAQANDLARGLKDIVDAEAGNYKRPTTDAGKNWFKVQKNLMLVTTTAGLPLATISSMVELGLSSKGLTTDQVFGKDKGSLATIGREGAALMSRLLDGTVNVATEVGELAGVGKGKNYNIIGKETAAKQKVRDLGYYDWDVGAATTTGVTELEQWQRPFYEAFFRATGLEGYTNYTRAIRASIAGDYILDKLSIASEAYAEGGDLTNEQQEAREALRNLGLNVEDMLGWRDAEAKGEVTPEIQQIFDENMRNATFNFINDAVALPQAANRPLIFQDPRFALFTQFQGFLSTFTANHIPKLWGEYVKRGTPAMKYNAFATMTTMIMLGFLSQHLKDMIKYGWKDDDEFKTGGNPYLDQVEYLQRGVRASGLFGTGERIIDLFFPIYENRSKNAAEWAWNEAAGQAPALSNLTRLAGGIGKVATGDSSGWRNIAKSTPVIGPFNYLTEGQAFKDIGDAWKF